MEYYFSTILNCSFEEAESKAIGALKKQGFGMISEIDMQQKLNEKLGVEIQKYKILGMCNPGFAYKALLAEEKTLTRIGGVHIQSGLPVFGYEIHHGLTGSGNCAPVIRWSENSFGNC